MMDDIYCPDCGAKTLRLIERGVKSKWDAVETRTCDICQNMIHIFRVPTPAERASVTDEE